MNEYLRTERVDLRKDTTAMQRVREEAEYEATDGQRKAYIDSRSEADTLIRQVENAYNDKKKTLDSETKKQIKSSLSYDLEACCLFCNFYIGQQYSQPFTNFFSKMHFM